MNISSNAKSTAIANSIFSLTQKKQISAIQEITIEVFVFDFAFQIVLENSLQDRSV